MALGLLLLLAIAARYITGVAQDDWDPFWNIAYVSALGVAAFLALYDRKNFPEKMWDFNPKRGLLYFLLGWIIFPVMMVVDGLFGAEFTLSSMAVATLVLSVFIGVAGTFTENVGV